MTIYRFGPFRLDKEQLLLSLNDVQLSLGPKVVETLLALVEHPGDVLGKSELLDRIWPEGFVEEANLAQNIYVIRKTLRAHWGCNAIETVPRRGYRFTGEVFIESTAQAHPAQAAAAAGARRKTLRSIIGAAAAVAAVLVAAIEIGTANVARSHAPVVSTQGLSATGARLYAIGKFYWNQRTQQSVAKSIRYFQEVVAADPRDARGYAGLACAYAIEANYGFGPPSKETAYARAASFAHKALAIDANSAEAHAVLGLVAADLKHMNVALAEFRRALALDPNSASAHQWYGTSLLLEGKSRAAYDQLQMAANLDPESVAAADWLAQASFLERRYKDAIAYGHQALDLSPQRYGALETVGMAYEALGNYHAAIAAYELFGRTCEYCRYDAAALLAHVYAITHDYGRAQQQLKIAERGIPHNKVDSDNIAVALVAMGRKNDAFRILQVMKSEPSALLAIDPRMDGLRDDPRFRQFTQSPG